MIKQVQQLVVGKTILPVALNQQSREVFPILPAVTTVLQPASVLGHYTMVLLSGRTAKIHYSPQQKKILS